MISIISRFFSYIVSICIILFVPGYCLLLAIDSRKKLFTSLENFILSFGLSIVITDFIMLFLGALKTPINRTSILLTILVFSLVCIAVYFFRSRKLKSPEPNQESFSKKQVACVVLILFLSFFIRSIYLSGAIIPSATDLGHHMYWANTIVKNGTIPNFQQRDIAFSEGSYSITPPHNISDFIIGEHLIFAAIALISGMSVISYFPILTLFLIDIFSLLAVFIFVIRLFDKNQEKTINIAILSLLFLGPIFAIMPPQAKFIGGGVVGNIIGNLLLPLTLYFYTRALREKNSVLLSLAILFSMGLFYTHHLTAFIFLFIFALIIFSILIINITSLKKLFLDFKSTIFSIPVLSVLIFAAIFAFSVYIPTYITNRAVSTVVGGPSKTGHNGLTLTDFKDTLGEPRVAFAIVGILLLLIKFGPTIYKLFKNKFSQRNDFDFIQILPAIFLLSWIIIIVIISLFPTLIHVDIPSGRVANYGTYPFAIIAAYAIAELASFLKSDKGRYLIKKSFLFPASLLIFVYIISFGYFDNSQNISILATPQKVQETFSASQYLAKNISSSDQILSDHINLTADSWIKIFFMKDYNFPFYRANLDRYDNGIDRQEKCTLDMITSPSSQNSQTCYSNLGIDFIMVNKKIDGSQFKKDDSFSLVYSNDDVNVYYRQAK